MIEYSSQQDRRFGAEVVHLHRLWEDIEGKRRRGRMEVVDFDLAGDVLPLIPEEDLKELNSISSRNQMLFKMSQIAERFDPNSLEGQFMRFRIRASLAHADASERRRSYSLDEYLEETLGLARNSAVAFNPVSEEIISEQRRVVSESFSLLGFDFDRVGWNRFFQGVSLDPHQIEVDYREAEDKFIPLLQMAVHLDYKPQYQLQFVNEADVSWINWTTGNEEGLFLKINTHPNTRMRWFQGVPERLVLHEVLVHMFEGYSWRENIRHGLINPGYGLTTIPGPEQWHCEGFGNTLAYFIPAIYQALSPHARFGLELRLLETWVQRNAHIIANQTTDKNRPETILEARDYTLDLLPHAIEEAVFKNLEQGVSNPHARAYSAAYGGSFEHWKFAQRLSSVNRELDQRANLVEAFLGQPLTPLQINNLVDGLEKQKSLLEHGGVVKKARGLLHRVGSVVRPSFLGLYLTHGTRESAEGKA